MMKERQQREKNKDSDKNDAVVVHREEHDCADEDGD